MRLLFDEQLSEDLLGLLRDVFPGSLHVRDLGAGGAADWPYGSSPRSAIVSSSRRTRTFID
ncbi:MAG: DUF5615 family PIN-like protein [Vicinamibacterales bacterium]